jgi:hypothetical protein
MRLEPLLDAQRIGGARRHLSRRATGRSPLDVLGRRPVPRVEEARWPPLGRRIACQQRLGVRHRVPALFESFAHRSEVLRSFRAVEDVARTLVGLQRLAVPLLRLSRDVRHLDVHIERADVVAERDEVFLGRLANLFPLALVTCLVSEERHKGKISPD